VYTPDTTDLRNPLLISCQSEDVLSENESELRKKKHHMCRLTMAASGLNCSSHCTTEHTGSSPSGFGSWRFWVTEVLYFPTSFPPHSQRKHLLVVEHILQVPSHLFSCTHESMRENGELNGVQFCSDVLQTLPSNLCTTVMALCCDPRSKVEGQRPT